jgi:hypothetical protein
MKLWNQFAAASAKILGLGKVIEGRLTGKPMPASEREEE